MSSVWILVILLPLIAAEKGYTTGIGKFEQRSFEFAVDKPFTFDATVQDFIITAIEHDVGLEMSHNCTQPLPIALQKCRQTFLYSSSETTHMNLIFQDEWLPYLLKVTHHKCWGSAKNDEAIAIQVIATEKTYCRFLFRYADKTKNFTGVKHASHSINVNQAANHSVVYKTAVDIDTLSKLQKVDLVTTFKQPVDVFLGKCDFTAPYRIRVGENLENKDVEVDTIIKMSKLLCREDKSRSFDTYLSSKSALHGNIFYDVFGANTPRPKETPNMMGRIIFLITILFFAGGIIAISMTYGWCLTSDGLADDEGGHYGANKGNRVAPLELEQGVEKEAKSEELQKLTGQEAWC